MNFQVQHAIEWMNQMNQKIQENKEYLTELDQAIGDGDHGINMSRGFQEVVEKLQTTANYEYVADVMKDIAMTLISKVGGASGPLFGTAFLKMSLVLKGHELVDYSRFVKGCEEAVQGIKQRGKAEVGEKTLVDVWVPVVEQLKKEEVFQTGSITQVAKEAMEHTRDMMATKGRAAYLKERSIGHIDPGATSTYYLFKSLGEAIEEGVE